jgi:hypothetical protein
MSWFICEGCDKKIDKASIKFVTYDALNLVSHNMISWNLFRDYSVCMYRSDKFHETLLFFIIASTYDVMTSW